MFNTIKHIDSIELDILDNGIRMSLEKKYFSFYYSIAFYWNSRHDCIPYNQ